MRFLYERGHKRRVMHLCGYDPRTGEPTMSALCGIKLAFNTTCNLPLGQRVCKRCQKAAP
jgi:hypothetical protein